ncbi:hypothetical protein EsH8_XV_000030 [Colletotrichum jinshuiense]
MLAADNGAWEMTRANITMGHRRDDPSTTTITTTVGRACVPFTVNAVVEAAVVPFTVNAVVEAAAVQAEASGSARRGEGEKHPPRPSTAASPHEGSN